jgi:hypothetical protein
MSGATQEPDWKAIAEALYLPLRSASCRCETAWIRPTPEKPNPSGRQTTKRCSRCCALNVYEMAVGLELTNV